MDDWPSVNFIISKKFFEDLKGFDEIYWPGEDSKLCDQWAFHNAYHDNTPPKNNQFAQKLDPA